MIEDLRQLIHGGDLLTCLERYPGKEFVDFSANINPLGLPPQVEEVLGQCGPASTRYPDQHCRLLRQALERFEGVPQSNILCGNGASDLIFRIVTATRPGKALVLAPTFSEYRLALEQVGCRVVSHQLAPEKGFQADGGLLPLVQDCDMVFLCNPNNPTGLLMEPDLLDQVVDACKARGAYLVVDECFLDFVRKGEDYSLKRRLGEYDRLILLRAFTKIFAMPGLRLGYALCGDQSLLARIDAAGPPWSVSVPAQLCGVAAAGQREYLERTIALVEEQRELLKAGLEALGMLVYPGTANYLLFRSGNSGLAEGLLERGIVLRDCSNFQGLEAGGYFRTAVRTRQENNALLEAIKETLA